jgi:hypothetical protein
MIDHIWSKDRDVTKSSNEGCNIGPHLAKVRDETKSSNEGHISDHIWSMSTVRQSPPMRGTLFLAVFGQSPR